MPLSSMDFVRRTSLLGMTILLSSGVVGCGGGEEEPAAAAASTGSSAPAAPADNGGDTVAAAPALMAPEAANAPQAPDSGESADAVASGAAPQMSGPPGMGMSGAPGMGMSGPPGMSSAAGGAAGAQFESAGPIGSGGPADMSMAGNYPGMQPGGYPGMQPGMGGNIPVSNRPAKVSDWSDEELKTAVMERDRRALEALTARVKKSPGDPKVAELIVALLAASNEAPPQPAQNPAGAFGAPSMGPPGMMPQGSAPSMGPPGMSTPGSSGPAMAPPKGGISGAPGMGSGAPQSRYVPRRALNSLEAMILESATAWQQPGVGAIASGFQAPGSGKVPGGAMSSGPPGLPSPDASAGGAGVPSSGPPGMSGMPMMSGPGMMAPGMSMPGSMPGSMNAGADATGSLSDEELVRGLADALVQNKSPLAWQTLFALVSGSVKTPLDSPKNSEIVVFSLCRNFNSDPAQIGQVLTALLDGSAPIPGESRVACLKALASVSGQAMDMNTGLQAGAAAGLPGGSPGGFPGSGMMGMGSMPPGMAPGGASTAAPSLMAPGASTAAPSLMAPGAMASGAGGMIEPSGEPGFNAAAASLAVTMPGERIPDNVLKEVVKVLWGDACVNAVAKSLASATDLSSAEALLMLGASMPSPRVREAELEFLTRIHSAGGDGLTNSGLVSGIARDPGFLVVLKSLPRSKAARGEDKNHLDSWAVARQTMVLALRDQLRAASAGGGKLKSVGEGFPVRLHRGGSAEYSGVLTVPAAEFGGAKGSEMKIYYARTTSTAQRKREEDELISHYEQKASGKGKLDQSKGLLWIDGTKTAANGVRRSMDVFISTGTSSSPGGFPGGSAAGPAMEGGAPGGGGAAGPTMTYPIEIVVVEVTDPKGAEAEAVPTGEPVKQ